MVSSDDIKKAVEGKNPKRDHQLSYGELGSRLASHRKGRFPGRPFGRAYISNLVNGQQPITKDFEDAFLSWRAAEIQRLDDFRAINVAGMGIDDLLQEAERIQQLGDGTPERLLLIGRDHPTHVRLNGVAREFVWGGEERNCEWKKCRKLYGVRSWNQRWCSSACRDAQRADEKKALYNEATIG